MITLKELGGKLSLSGQVRARFEDFNETKNGIKQRGAGGATDKPTKEYKVQVDLLLDYRADRTWASIKLKFADGEVGIIFIFIPAIPAIN